MLLFEFLYMYILYFCSVSSGTVVSAKSQPPPELPPEPTAEGINFIRVYKLSDISFMSGTLNILKLN